MSLKNWGRIAGLFGLVVLFSAVFNWLFVTGSVSSAGVIARLRQYNAQTDKLTVEFVDPFKHPGRVKELNISQSGPRVIVKSGNKESRAKEISEEALTNALIEVSRGATKKIYFTKCHGEHAVADNTERGLKLFVDNIKGEGLQTDEIVLAEQKEIPADPQPLVIAGCVGPFAAW